MAGENKTQDTLHGDESLLRRDPIWKAHRFDSFSAFVNRHAPFCFRPQIPEAIRKRLSAVHKLLLHSYFEYEFLDIAFARAMQIVEMALRVRYQEVERKEPSERPTLDSLIKWADKKQLLDEGEDRTQLLRTIRNFVIHSQPETLFGITAVDMVYSVVDFINELYEDTNERKQRHATERSVQSVLSRVIAEGAMLCVHGVRLIVFRAESICCVIKEGTIDLHVGFMPIFDPKEHNGTTDVPEPIFVVARRYSVDDSYVEFQGTDGELVTIQSIMDPVNRDRYQKFLSDHDSCPMLDTVVRLPFAEYRRKLKRSLVMSCEQKGS